MSEPDAPTMRNRTVQNGTEPDNAEPDNAEPDTKDKDTAMDTPDTDVTPLETTPRIRTAGVVWGLILAAISAAVIAFAGWPQQRTQVNNWAASIGWPGLWAAVVIAVGVLVLVLVGLSVVKRAQLRRRVRR